MQLETSSRSPVIDLTASADRRLRKGTRDPRTVDALVLHQMACCFRPRDPLQRFLTLTAHFAILADGRILQLHPASALLWASNGFNARSVAVEFAGNFPDVRGRWWEGARFGRNQVTRAQVAAGIALVQHLIATLGIRHVFAHRQSSATRTNDPGPDIWFHVGQRAVSQLGLSDGGPGYKIGTGNPIPDAWRTWGRPVAPELGAEFEADVGETELAHDSVMAAQAGAAARPHVCAECGARRAAGDGEARTG
ncbi:MAG TPA: peptidoglycan recognition family protein [Kofleriaceae bacterium]|nr:peptidoglycan recognition family protein [Kofleriaceae bacterium]